MNVCIEEISSVLTQLNIKHTIQGRKDVKINTYSPLNNAVPNTITWVKKWTVEIYERLEAMGSLIIVCNNKETNYDSKINCLISCEDPKMVFFEIMNHFFVHQKAPSGISDKAVVETKTIGKNCSIGPFTYIGTDVKIGDDVTISANVTIEGKVCIGDRCAIGPSCSVGGAGFGLYKDTEGHQKRVPHMGGIVIGDDVEIRANTVVDRGTMGDTRIGDRTKIDCLCVIAHNAQVGQDVVIVGCTSIGGSCVIADGSYIGPNSSIMNQIKLGKNSFVGIHTTVIKDVKDDEKVFGNPARKVITPKL